jgi:hypothetical protein
MCVGEEKDGRRRLKSLLDDTKAVRRLNARKALSFFMLRKRRGSLDNLHIGASANWPTARPTTFPAAMLCSVLVLVENSGPGAWQATSTISRIQRGLCLVGR